MKTVAALITGAALALVAAGCGGASSSASEPSAPESIAVAGGGVAGAPAKDVAVSEAVFPQTQGLAGGPGITVTGTGTATAVPDIADWSFGVQSDAATASEALKAASSATRKIVDALRAANVDRSDIRTEQVSVYPRMSSDGRTIDGYTASSSVTAVLRDIGRSGEVVDAAVAAGANQVYGPSLRLSDEGGRYRDAVDSAYDDARSRAEAIAAKAGVTLGAPVAIVEGGGGGGPIPLGVRAIEDSAADVAIEPGTQDVTATLTVTFAIS